MASDGRFSPFYKKKDWGIDELNNKQNHFVGEYWLELGLESKLTPKLLLF